MKNLKKPVVFLLLITGLAAHSYGETLYNISMGYYRYGETFFRDNFGRVQNGMSYNFTFYYFPKEENSFGLMARTAFGTFFTGYEWKDDKMRSVSTFGSDVRLCAAASYRFRPGSSARIPISLGPVFTIQWEEFSEWGYNDDNGGSWHTSYFYEALKLGLMADVSFIFNFNRDRFLLMQGISVNWDFLHGEKGRMRSEYRVTQSGRSQVVPYSAVGLAIYFGIGFKLD